MQKSPTKPTPPVGKKDISLTDIWNALVGMQNDIQSINTKLLTQENTATAILSRMNALSSEIVSLKKENEVLKKDIDTLMNSQNNIKSDYAPIEFSGVDIIHENHERDSKSRNIILFNIDESVSDIDSLAKELIVKLKLDSNISMVTRLGKHSAKPRPIRITFDSSKSVIDVLKA